MAKIDKIKEEIGWLKVVFTLLVATDISMIGWVAQKFENLPTWLLSISIVAVVFVTGAIIVVNKHVYKKLDVLGELE
jgi:4-hydroxybenzoate polyprenyltransferase